MVFGPIPKSATTKAMPSIIGVQDQAAFTLLMDDHMCAATSFEELFKFLHEQYFPRVAFGPTYSYEEPASLHFQLSFTMTSPFIVESTTRGYLLLYPQLQRK